MSATPSSSQSSSSASATNRFLPLLLLLFVGSGCAALIYEVVWYQMLQLVIGLTTISLGLLLGSFMGGMCLGSIAVSRLVARGRHPLKVYALLELGIGAIGILELWLVPAVGALYSDHAGSHSYTNIILRGVVAAVCLVPPTLLMGATLPVVARWVKMTPSGVSWLGFFYGGNIAGAVFGCLLAGFYLLRVHDMATATFVAAGINVTVALLALALASDKAVAPLEDEHPGETMPMAAGSCSIYVAIALSGLTALGAEVVWTRLLSLLLGGTVYTFSIILAVFLFGLGIGSSAGSLVSRTKISPRLALGLCQFLLMAGVAWTAFNISYSLPHWPIDPSLIGDMPQGTWYVFQLDLALTAWTVLPAAMLWGASFPLALAAVATPEADPGRVVGRVYAANTVGAIVGALFFSIIAVPAWGTEEAQRILIGLAGLSTFLVLVPMLFRQNEKDAGASLLKKLFLLCDSGIPVADAIRILAGRVTDPMQSLLAKHWWRDVQEGRKFADALRNEPQAFDEDTVAIIANGERTGNMLPALKQVATLLADNEGTVRAPGLGVAILLVATLVVAPALGWTIGPAAWGTIAYGRKVATYQANLKPDLVKEKDVPSDNSGSIYCLYTGEGLNGTVAVTMTSAGVRSFHSAGKIQASNDPHDMRLQRMLGHLSALAVTKPKSVLVVACGAGVTAGTFLTNPDVERITICDIEPLVPKFVTPMFTKENYGITDGVAQQNPRTLHTPSGDKIVTVVYDDGRHFIRTTKEKFDVITSDPIDPWVKGCAALNTIEYYQMCKDHLNPGGVMSLWIPFYESNDATAKSVLATFFQVYPKGILWSNDYTGDGYDAVLFGQPDGTKIDVDEWKARVDRPEFATVKQSLSEAGFPTVADLLGTYAGRASDLQVWMKDAAINEDKNLRLQYLAGMAVNTYHGTEILHGILSFYKYPDDVFSGSAAEKESVRQAIEIPRQMQVRTMYPRQAAPATGN